MDGRSKFIESLTTKLQTGEKTVAEFLIKDSVFPVTESNRKGWKNKIGNDGDCPNCGHWKDHWEKVIQKKAIQKKFDEQPCSKEGCSNKAEVGAHVIHSQNSQKEWIAPFCSGCNVTENLPDTPIKTFSLKIGTILVDANPKICESLK